ncbi:MAG: response regulator [Lachnospiraceae bacterium]|nr:response regulator [Lachnospiraceae bacterium]MBR1568628.1 response regulator [Lachnospiraceae bacterium]
MNILVVEDDAVSRKVMTYFVNKYGDCQTAEDGEKAVELYKHAWEQGQPYNLICMDIKLPGMDGYDTIEKIREYETKQNIPEFKKAKVIITSGMDAGENIPKSFELGCVAFASKPIEFAQFDSLLRELQLI